MEDFTQMRGPVPIRTRPGITAVSWRWEGDADSELSDWLGSRFGGWQYVAGELMLQVQGDSGNKILAKPGYLLLRYPDGSLAVMAPMAAVRPFELDDGART